jgi:hypothetical protein
MKKVLFWLVMLACVSSARTQSQTVFTGLIVDARGGNFAPCFSPKIWTSSGREVWGTFEVSSEFVNTVGIAAFARTLEQAKEFTDRGAPNQLMVKAQKVVNVCEVVISSSDATRVLLANRNLRFLEAFKVTFLF